MIKLFDPEVMHVVCAALGAVAGWLLKGRWTPSSDVPPELAELVQALLARRRQQLAQAMLNDLAEAAGQKPAAGSSGEVKKGAT